MKVLKHGSTVLTFPLGGTKFVGLDSKDYDTGIVAEMPEAAVKRMCAAALPKANADGTVTVTGSDNRFHFMEVRDFMRDLRWISKRLTDVPVGTEGIGMEAKGRGVTLRIPEGAVPEAPEPKVGDVIAVNANITPKALMNARGIVVSVNGTRLKARLTKGDLKRVLRATGKSFPAEVSLPKASVEVDDECLVEVVA